MNPNTGNQSGMQLPPPVVEQAPVPAQAAPTGPERTPAAPERGRQVTAAPSTALPTNVPMPLPAAPPINQPAGAVPAAQAAVLPTTDDGDLIEKEWVNKAKAIVERTHNDPYTQSEELTVVKADYMKARYGKNIKLNK